MASNQKEVKVKVATEEELSGVEALELRIDRLEKQKIQIGIDIASQKLEETQARIEQLKQEKANLEVGVDDSKIKEINAEIAQLEQESLDLQLKVETGELQKAKADIEELDGKEVELNLAMQNFSQGIDQAKQGVQELYGNVQDVQQAAIQSQQNEAFLALNLGADKAKTTMDDIKNIVAKMPGDDNTMRSILSSAQALGANLSFDDMSKGASAMADYMAGSAANGKNMAEVENDLKDYILNGNTASLERDSIYKSQLDKMKDLPTVQDRINALQEAGNTLGYAGLANADTMIKKQGEWEGMMYNAQDLLANMWLPAEQGAMDYIMNLDEASGHLVSMTMVAGQMVAGPLVSIFSGISQIGMGFKTLKEAADFTGITDKFNKLKDTLGGVKNKVFDLASSLKDTLMGAFNTLKTTLTNSIIPALKNAGLSMLDLGKKALTAGANALKSAGMWIVEKAALVAHKIASWASAAAQWALNIAMDANPIMLVVLAIIALVAILAYLYFNNEQVRAAIDGLGQTFIMVGQIIYTSFVNAINWIIGALQNLWNYIFTLGGLLPANVSITGNQIIDTILRVLAFLATLPLQIGMIFINIIAKALGFGDNFVQNMIRAGSKSVSNFMSYISSLPGKLQTELSNMLSAVGQWAATLPQKFWDAGVNAVKNFLSALGIASPGTMQRMLIWEISEMGNRIPGESKKLLSNVSDLGSNIVDSFGDPTLGLNYEDTMNSQLETIANSNGSSSDRDIIFNMYGDMDNEDRMEKFVDAVIRRLHFENSTAGRTV